jgi:hypothetical protein
MIGSSVRRHGPRRDGDVSGPPADQWDWHEVVANERFSPAHSRAAESGWTWGHTWTVVRLSVLPFLVTAVALTTALLTLVGLVARPLPWSPAPVFGGSSDRRAAPAPTSPPIIARSVPARSKPIPSPSSTAVRDAPTIGGAAASGTPIASSTAGAARPARPGASISTSSNSPGLTVPLPPLPVSVSVSVSIPGPLPLPPVVITLP